MPKFNFISSQFLQLNIWITLHVICIQSKKESSRLVREVLSWQLGCALATLGKRVGGGRREILTCRNFMHHAVQPPLNWSAIGRQWRQRSRQYGSQLPRPSPRYTVLNFVKGTLYLKFVYGTIHKGRPQNFRVLRPPPPLSAFWLDL